MSDFYLNTDALRQNQEEISKISNDLNSIKYSIKGINFSEASSEFNFSGAVNAISENIENLSTKVNGISSYFDRVISDHNKTQKNLQTEATNLPVSSSNTSSAPYVSNTSYTTSSYPSNSISYTNSSSSSASSGTFPYSTYPTSTAAFKNNSPASQESTSSSVGSNGGLNISAPAGSLLDAMTVNQRSYGNANVNVTGASMAAGVAGSTFLSDIMASILGNKKDDSSEKVTDFENYYSAEYDDPILNDYGFGETIKDAGSAPVSMAMVASYLTGKKEDPVKVANWSLAHNFRDQEKGTSFDFFKSISEGYGLNCHQSDVSEKAILSSLKIDHPVIMFVKNEVGSGHYMVLKGLTAEGKVLVADPTSKTVSAQAYDIDYFLNQGDQMWTFSKKIVFDESKIKDRELVV